MALTLLDDWGSRCERPWGYEVRVSFLDTETQKVHDEVLNFEKEPDAEMLEARVAAVADHLTARLLVPEVTPVDEKEALRAEVETLKGTVAAVTTEKAVLAAKVATLEAAAKVGK